VSPVEKFVVRRGWTDKQVEENFGITHFQSYAIYGPKNYPETHQMILEKLSAMVIKSVTPPRKFTSVQKREMRESLKASGVALCGGMKVFGPKGRESTILEFTCLFVFLSGGEDLSMEEFCSGWKTELDSDQILEAWRVDGFTYADIQLRNGKVSKNVLLRK